MTADALTSVTLIYLGGMEIVDQKLSVGTLYAFMSYRAQFSARILALSDQLVSWRMPDMHTTRLADIVLEPPEAGIDQGLKVQAEMKGHIRLDNVAFRYAPRESPVFQQVHLEVEPGGFVAIVGPSGGGKSTLLKVICGLYPANGGR